MAEVERVVQISLGPATLGGNLSIPHGSRGIVLFAHGSGSSRQSPRNLYVARVLQQASLATLLMDLLTEEEETHDASAAALRFDIGRFSRRLVAATHWLLQQPETTSFSIGYFAASTGAAAALVAAAELNDVISAIVSRGGRPDLAGEVLHRVVAPTLLILGGNDPQVLALNRQALSELPGPKRLEIIPGATHLFEQKGALETVAQLARDWFSVYLGHPYHRVQTA
jgi:putative phosphoribosyl transferase